MKNIFFGAGKIGRRELEWWQKRSAAPDYFVDNDKSRWGSTYFGIPVISLDQAKDVHCAWFWITCVDREGIRNQLLSSGIEPDRIRDINKDKMDFNRMLYAYGQSKGFEKNFIPVEDNPVSTERKVIFDLENGLVLGGVESWTIEMSGKLADKGYVIKYLTNNLSGHLLDAGDVDLIELNYLAIESKEERVIQCVNEILRFLPCNLICNFAESNFTAACIVKKMYPEKINVVAVIHNDQSVYYNRYGLWQEYIDHLLVISNKMRGMVEERQIGLGRICNLGWHTPCSEIIDRVYSCENEPIRIGYAGRLRVYQKRSDLLLEIAVKLKKNNIDYILEIAGTGEYEQEIRDGVKKSGLEKRVKFLGFIDRTDIPAFWKRQDIAISCSDFEGRSISKAEAMASGAVPVVSDTSGARDDIIDGWNGYVLECGRWEPFVETIGALAKDRKKIETMGRNAHRTILENNEKNASSDLWERILV